MTPEGKIELKRIFAIPGMNNVTQVQTTRKRWFSIKIIILSLAGLFSLLVLITIFNSVSSTIPVAIITKKNNPLTKNEDKSQIMASYKSSAKQVNISDIYNNPNLYKDSIVTFTGEIDQIYEDNSGGIIAANVGGLHGDYVRVNFSSFVTNTWSPMLKGDSITVWGRGEGTKQSGDSVVGITDFGAVKEVYLDDHTNHYSDDSDTSPITR